MKKLLLYSILFSAVLIFLFAFTAGRQQQNDKVISYTVDPRKKEMDLFRAAIFLKKTGNKQTGVLG